MNLINLENVMKQKNNQFILKNISLTLNKNDQVGIKMTHEESQLLFKLITGKVAPSSGTVECQTTGLLSEMKDDGLYENLTVSGYLKFFKKIANYPVNLEPQIEAFSLLDVWQTKVKLLNPDQKKRVSLFRLFLFQPQVLLIESPLTNLTDEGIELYLRALEYIRQQEIATLFTAYYIEELLLLSKDIYRYQRTIGLEKTDLVSEDSPSTSENESHHLQPRNVFKVACKLADKTIFFSPNEIDYIESINSVSNIRIGEEYFPSVLTMTELEEKLAHFGFFRCHRSYLVNLQRISELISYSKNSYTLILKGNSTNKLPLSRTRLEEMKQLIEG
ncbi:LytTR family transcriptional regulator DNA-binding domain-containing protein [Enterococcus sp. AZ072]|uniref:LytTR family transcriptional regulator DNA-binding domain-containing protein n=2 Tax=Enterococcus TaxID=1350 RepID=UPI003D27EC1D